MIKVKLHELEKLAKHYGYNTRLWQVIEQFMEEQKPYECPKCHGEGTIEITYNAYPSGLPDSGWVYEPKTKVVECDLCGGEGYTSVEYKPNIVQQGWVAKQEEDEK